MILKKSLLIFVPLLSMLSGYGCWNHMESYNYSCKRYNFSSSHILITESTRICDNGMLLLGSIAPFQSSSTSSFYDCPYSSVMVTWLVTEKNSTEEKRYKELLSINLPKEFTAYDGAAIIFCFDNNGRAWVAYEYYYGSSDEDAKNSYMRRISRKRKTVLGDGTNFNTNDYSKYKQSNPRGTLEDFLRKEIGAIQ